MPCTRAWAGRSLGPQNQGRSPSWGGAEPRFRTGTSGTQVGGRTPTLGGSARGVSSRYPLPISGLLPPVGVIGGSCRGG